MKIYCPFCNEESMYDYYESEYYCILNDDGHEYALSDQETYCWLIFKVEDVAYRLRHFRNTEFYFEKIINNHAKVMSTQVSPFKTKDMPHLLSKYIKMQLFV